MLHLCVPRDSNLREIRRVGRKKRVLNSPSHGECKKHPRQRKRESGYHRRSLSETTMFRLKVIFGGKLRRRKFDSQAVELFVQCAMLNPMIQYGKPENYKVEI